MIRAVELVVRACSACVSWFLQILTVDGAFSAYITYLVLSMICIIIPSVSAIHAFSADCRQDVGKGGGTHK